MEAIKQLTKEDYELIYEALSNYRHTLRGRQSIPIISDEQKEIDARGCHNLQTKIHYILKESQSVLPVETISKINSDTKKINAIKQEIIQLTKSQEEGK